MFDIISYIREKILRRPQLVTPVAGEELSEKQTTKLGYFLLYCMFGAILASAQLTLSIIQSIPESPTQVPGCINEMLYVFENEINHSYSSYSYKNCTLTATNPQFDFTLVYNNLEEPFDQINRYNDAIQDLESKKQQIQYNQRSSQEDYNTSLVEKVAKEEAIYDSQEIQKNIKDNRLMIINIDKEIDELIKKISEIRSQYNAEIDALRTEISNVQDDYQASYLLYKLYIALLSFLFAISTFIVLYKIYIKQKLKNSPHTIIFSVATFAYGLVILQISCLFIWDIIPHKFLNWIENLFVLFSPLVYLIQFLWPILIILIFGLAIYKIQKRLYSPENILKRFIADKKCPSCGNDVDFTKPFCPLCSHEIHIHCSHCHELTLKGMPYCSNCGKDI